MKQVNWFYSSVRRVSEEGLTGDTGSQDKDGRDLEDLGGSAGEGLLLFPSADHLSVRAGCAAATIEISSGQRS